MEEALKRVKSMRADMGGTEILQPLKHIYSQPCYPDHPRQVQHTLTESFRKTKQRSCPSLLLSQLFIFTDGEVRNTKEILDLVKSHVYSHRCVLSSQYLLTSLQTRAVRY